MARGLKIRIRAGTVTAEATLNGTATAEKIWNALPVSARASTWGDEVYFSGDEVRAASAVNVIGRVLGDPTIFKQVREGVRVTLEQA